MKHLMNANDKDGNETMTTTKQLWLRPGEGVLWMLAGALCMYEEAEPRFMVGAVFSTIDTDVWAIAKMSRNMHKACVLMTHSH